jgi:hypothetical protein
VQGVYHMCRGSIICAGGLSYVHGVFVYSCVILGAGKPIVGNVSW